MSEPNSGTFDPNSGSSSGSELFRIRPLVWELLPSGKVWRAEIDGDTAYEIHLRNNGSATLFGAGMRYEKYQDAEACKKVAEVRNRERLIPSLGPVPDALLSRALDALRALRDEQNGPPLERWRERWQAAMDEADAVLEEGGA